MFGYFRNILINPSAPIEYIEIILEIIHYELKNGTAKRVPENKNMIKAFEHPILLTESQYEEKKEFLIERSKIEKIPMITDVIFDLVENSFEHFKLVEDIYEKDEDFINIIFNTCILLHEDEILEYICSKYTIKEPVHYFKFSLYISTIKILENFYPDYLEKSSKYYLYHFLYDGNMDILHYIFEKMSQKDNFEFYLDKARKMMGENTFGCVIPYSKIDPVEFLLDKDPNIFKYVKDWNFWTTIDIAILLRSRGLARKICPINLVFDDFSKEFIIECQHEIGIKDFILGFPKKFYICDDNTISYANFICLFDDYVIDHDKYLKLLRYIKKTLKSIYEEYIPPVDLESLEKRLIEYGNKNYQLC